MANGYAIEEALDFCTEYLKLQAYSKRHVWETKEEQGMRESWMAVAVCLTCGELSWIGHTTMSFCTMGALWT